VGVRALVEGTGVYLGADVLNKYVSPTPHPLPSLRQAPGLAPGRVRVDPGGGGFQQ
jgi:hypothetical protein